MGVTELIPDFHMWMTFAVIALAIGFFVTEKLSLEVTSLGVIALLLILFFFFPLTGPDGEVVLSTRDILAGFADPALIAVLALLVVGQGLVQSGALDEVAHFIVSKGTHYPRLIVVLILLLVLVLSAVLNNTPVVVIFIPILAAVAARIRKSVSKVMIPLSFAAILGGNLTLIGSSTNLLVSGSLESVTGKGLDFFDLTVPGAVLAAAGFIFLLLVAPRLLKDRASLAGAYILEGGKQFLVQAEVRKDSFLEGLEAKAGMFTELKDLTVRLVQRGEEPILPPYDNVKLKKGDVLVLAGTRQVLTELLKKEPGLLKGIIEESPDKTAGEPNFEEAQPMVAEVMVAPASRMLGLTLKQIGFFRTTNCVVLGIQRRSRMVRANLDETRLEAGDVLLVMGSRRNVMALRASRDVVLLEWSAQDLPMAHHSKLALTVFALVIVFAGTGFVPIVIAAVIGVFLMILGGCLNIRQAARAVDRRIVLIIAAALAMGAALSATGGAQFVAMQMLSVTQGQGVVFTLSAFFLIIAGFTNILSNNATAVLFTPIAISIANEIGVDPMVFVITVVMAANCSFATPIGYQTNLLVMAPGHYRFSDFIRVGVLLILVLWVAFTLFAPWYYNLV